MTNRSKRKVEYDFEIAKRIRHGVQLYKSVVVKAKRKG
jgi:hypothetical protein